MKKCFAKLWVLGAVGGMIGFLHSIASAQGLPQLQITAIQAAPGSPVQFTFNDAGTGATNYLVEFAPDLQGGGVWSNITSAVVQSLGGGNFRVHVPDPQSPLGFFRVRGYGGEAGLISASFNSTALQVTEGGVVSPTITFSVPYHGIVHYTISGTAAAGDYISLSGEVFVNGTSATIPVTALDNQSIGQLRYLTLTLQAGPGLQLGAASATTITIDENDADWRGTFRARGANLGFVLTIKQLNGSPMAALSSDRLGFFPDNESSVAVTLLSGVFQANASGIPFDGSTTPFGTPVQLQLHLEASNTVANQSVGPDLIEGVGYLISTYTAQPQLTTSNYGTFTLYKPAIAPSTNQVDLVDSF